MNLLATTIPKTGLTEALESQLGDPKNPENPLSFAYSQKIDETEQFPHEAIHWLYERELARHYVPEELGGSFRSFAELADVIRVLSRRDVSSAVAFSTLFWSFLAWVGGADEQKRWLAKYMMERHGAMCLAYSEKEHGADLAASDTVARRTADGFEITGEKWPINRATVGGLCFVLATTNPSAGASGLSLFMLDKGDLDPKRHSNFPKIPTHGMRGSDISGIKFEDCPVPARSLLGGEGGGLQLALRGFQITRALCAAISLGAGDTALRTTLSFALNRRLYGGLVIDLPHAAAVLSDAFLDLLISDCVTISGLRSFHVVPEQSSLWASIVKYFVPTTIEAMIQNLSVVLGARYYMREEHEWGTFQRIVRDAAVVSLFDGSTVVNLHALMLQFRHLSRRRAARGDQDARLGQIFDLNSPLPPWNGQRLSLVSPQANDALEGVEHSLKQLKAEGAENGADRALIEQILALGETLKREIASHNARFAESEFEHGHLQSAAMFRAAQRYCALHAAASCLHSWVWNRTHSSSFFAKGKWLVPALARIFDRHLNIHHDDVIDASRPELLQELQRLYRDNRMFSISEAALGSA
ncbi:MAG: acyl-CoA dehydrogenase [Hyphomicrobiales bacterium]|nr:acyl-CoA dehydrogenase [Hyphomicrobiales bacterium]